MALSMRPSEVFVQNSNLQEQNEELQRQYQRFNRHPSIFQKISRKSCPSCVGGSCIKLVVISLLIVTAIIVYSVSQFKQDSTLESLVAPSAERQTSGENSQYGIQIQLEKQPSYQDCGGSQLKQSFPDLDYAFLGYNILTGFPLAVGHDPGFTYPIFKADYSAGKQTADCRYSVPKGLVVIPDVSCVTSFSSTTIRTKYEFSNALSVYTKAKAKTWGYSFSASFGYKSFTSKMSSSKYVYILSTAKCNYYFSKLVTENAPQFDDVFIKWIRKLNGGMSDPELYFNFFQAYGTHFVTEVTFGARYTYEYKMKSSFYEKQTQQDINVKASASLRYGFWKLKSKFQLSNKQEKAMSDFRENVETKTTTVGAPPPEDGNADVWASEVKENPVPSSYKLSSIENLFTATYMKSLGVDYNGIFKKIVSYKQDYCLFLQKKGEIDSCEELAAGIELKNTRIFEHYKEEAATSLSNCIEVCLDDIPCVAVSFCTTCSPKSRDYKTCHLITENNTDILTGIKTDEENVEWQSNVFPGKIDFKLVLNNTGVIGVPRGFENEEDKQADMQKCEQLCIEDAYCSAFSYTESSNKVLRCKMYGLEQMNGLQPVADTDTFFISI